MISLFLLFPQNRDNTDSFHGVQDTISNFHKMLILSNWPPPYELQQLKISPEKDLGKGFCKKHDQKKRGKDEKM